MQRLCWPPDAFLTTKCAAPDCAREWRSGRCNAECVIGQTTATPAAGANNSNASAASRCGLTNRGGGRGPEPRKRGPRAGPFFGNLATLTGPFRDQGGAASGATAVSRITR